MAPYPCKEKGLSIKKARGSATYKKKQASLL